MKRITFNEEWKKRMEYSSIFHIFFGFDSIFALFAFFTSSRILYIRIVRACCWVGFLCGYQPGPILQIFETFWKFLWNGNRQFFSKFQTSTKLKIKNYHNFQKAQKIPRIAENMSFKEFLRIFRNERPNLGPGVCKHSQSFFHRFFLMKFRFVSSAPFSSTDNLELKVVAVRFLRCEVIFAHKSTKYLHWDILMSRAVV